MHDLTDVSLWDEILDTLKEGGWCVIVSPPCNTFSRARFQHLLHPGPKPLRTKSWPKGFPWLSNANKLIVTEANFFVEKCLEACECAASANGFFVLEHPEDLGTVQGEQPGSIWQWHEVLDLIPRFSAVCFAIHQCQFGALTPKPTRLLTNLHVDDSRCHFSLPKFDKLGFYKGPLPRKCGHRHTHKLIGKTGTKWNTSPSAAYPPGMCKFLAQCILNAFASCGGGSENSPGPPRKRPSGTQGSPVKRRRTGSLGAVSTGTTAAITTVQSGSVLTSSCSDTGKLLGCNNTCEDSNSSAVETVKPCSSTACGAEQAFEATGSAQVQSVGVCPLGSDEDFDLQACGNAGKPIQVEWDRVSRGFVDGFGLCSPSRWRPSQRGERRTPDMLKLANKTFDLLASCVDSCIPDVRKEAFRLVTGKIQQSPFGEPALQELRTKWAALLPDPVDALKVDEGQPFLLRAVSQFLKAFRDPDAHWLVDEDDSFASGICIGVDKPLPRSPQVFPWMRPSFVPSLTTTLQHNFRLRSWRKSSGRRNNWAGCSLRRWASSSRSLETDSESRPWQRSQNLMGQCDPFMTPPIQSRSTTRSSTVTRYCVRGPRRSLRLSGKLLALAKPAFA